MTMKTIHPRIILAATVAVAVLAFSFKGKPKAECPCKLKAFINYDDTTSVNVVSRPNGKVTFKLKADDEALMVDVKASKRGWLQLETVSGDGNEGAKEGWVAGVAGIYTRNFDGGILSLYKGPNHESGEAAQLYGMQEVGVDGCCGQWALVRGKDKNGKIVKGWIAPEMQCAKPDGSCQ
ncbi:MAG: hypothetical protein FD123_533 [Bacteroidetes bacterium]|nr:MAG: hypothetical protein FD123_533 [Bacteroidota bacterium]